ncbi:MAG: hypothetical protein WBV61_05910 [Rhodanobacteraceae bacterium]
MPILQMPLYHLSDEELRLRYWETVSGEGYASSERDALMQELARRRLHRGPSTRRSPPLDPSAWDGIERRSIRAMAISGMLFAGTERRRSNVRATPIR